VDYSFLLTAVATAPASPTECGGGASDRPSGGGGEAGAARGAARGAEERAPVVPPRLLQACYCRHVAAASASDTAAAAATTTITATTASSTSSTASASSAAPYESTEATETAEAGKAGAAPSLECSHVLARLAVIDYLRGWRLVEAGEHVRKSLSRDLFARERNHAVVPVRHFARSFRAHLDGAMLAPLQRRAPSVGLARCWITGVLRGAWRGSCDRLAPVAPWLGERAPWLGAGLHSGLRRVCSVGGANKL